MPQKLKENNNAKRRINLFDILLIFIVIAAAAAAAWWSLKSNIKAEESFKIIYTVEFKAMKDYPFEKVDVTGQVATDAVINIEIGKIVRFWSEPYVDEIYDRVEGKVFFGEIANELFYYMEIEADAERREKGRLFLADDYVIGYGMPISLRTIGFTGNGYINGYRIVG